MRIAIITGGSRGDVQPYVALGLGLKEAGHEVLLAAPVAFERLVRGRGLGFHQISLDLLEAVRRQLEKGDANLLERQANSRSILAPVMQSDLKAYLEACRGGRSGRLFVGRFPGPEDSRGVRDLQDRRYVRTTHKPYPLLPELLRPRTFRKTRGFPQRHTGLRSPFERFLQSPELPSLPTALVADVEGARKRGPA